MNDSNLIPMNQRTESEQREITRKGGIESGKARRRKKTLKDISKTFLNARADDSFTEQLKEAGFEDDEMTNAAAIIVSLADNFFAFGNMKAAELLFKYSGEDPDQKRKDAELKLKQEELKLKQMENKQKNDPSTQEAAIRARAAIWAKVKEEIAATEKGEPVKIVFDIPDDGREPRIDHANE